MLSKNLRLDFIRIIRWFKEQHLLTDVQDGYVHSKALIHRAAIIESGARIGSGSIIGPNSNIKSNVILGKNVKVGVSTVIGSDGFSYEADESGKLVNFPHLGGVLIKDNVHIGNLYSISRGVLGDTCIQDEVKVGDQVYIARGTFVGINSMIMSGVRLNGRVSVGESCWIGTGALIREGCVIGGKTTIGMGSVVVNNILENSVAFGNPAIEREKICVE